MNKNLIMFIGFILLAVIGVQSYLLYKKDNPEITDLNTPIIKTIEKKDEPQVSINIDKTPLKKEEKQSRNNDIKSNLTPQAQMELDTKKIEDDVKKLFSDLFGSKEVQDGLKEFKEQAELGLKQLQEQMQNLPKELEKFSQEAQQDPFFSQVFSGLLNGTKSLNFEDKGDHYYLQIPLPQGKDSKVDIKTKGNILSILVEQKHTEKKIQNNSTIQTASQSKSQDIVMIPHDAFVDKLNTKYKDNVLEITVPKVINKRSL
jgi:HSP20 family molecular chaperone IbpA